MSSPTLAAEDQQEFERVLGALVRSADRADVDVSQTRNIVADDGGYWEVDFSRVDRTDTADSPDRASTL